MGESVFDHLRRVAQRSSPAGCIERPSSTSWSAAIVGYRRLVSSYRFSFTFTGSASVGFVVEGRQPVREGAKIFSGNQKVGVVTSGGFSPSLQVPIAMGYVDLSQSTIGTSLEADVRGKRVPLTVAAMPFTPHRYHRKGSPK